MDESSSELSSFPNYPGMHDRADDPYAIDSDFVPPPSMPIPFMHKGKCDFLNSPLYKENECNVNEIPEDDMPLSMQLDL
jgi:hypothetical protein